MVDWNILVKQATTCESLVKVLRRILSTNEVVQDPQAVSTIVKESADELWKAYSALDTLLTDIDRHDSVDQTQ